LRSRSLCRLSAALSYKKFILLEFIAPCSNPKVQCSRGMVSSFSSISFSLFLFSPFFCTVVCKSLSFSPARARTGNFEDERRFYWIFWATGLISRLSRTARGALLHLAFRRKKRKRGDYFLPSLSLLRTVFAFNIQNYAGVSTKNTKTPYFKPLIVVFLVLILCAEAVWR
jgi:hypothetical protein